METRVQPKKRTNLSRQGRPRWVREIHNAVAGRLRHPPASKERAGGEGCIDLRGPRVSPRRTYRGQQFTRFCFHRPSITFLGSRDLCSPRILSVAVAVSPVRVSINFVDFLFSNEEKNMIKNVYREEEEERSLEDLWSYQIREFREYFGPTT